MPSCSVADCKNWYNGKNCSGGIVYHTYPRDIRIAREWLIKSKRDHKLNVKSSRICSDHFLKTDYYPNGELKPGTIPSVFKNRQPETGVENSTVEGESERFEEGSAENSSIEKYCQFCVCPMGLNGPGKINEEEESLLQSFLIENKIDLVPSIVCCVVCFEKVKNSNKLIEQIIQLQKELQLIKEFLLKYQKSSSEMPTEIGGHLEERSLDKNESLDDSGIQRDTDQVHDHHHNVKQTLKATCIYDHTDITNDNNYAKSSSIFNYSRSLNSQKPSKSKKRTLTNRRMPLKNVANKSKSINKVKNEDLHSNIFSKGQLNLLNGAKKIKWDVKDIVKSFTLRILGLKAYNLIRTSWNIPLPGLSTLRRWGSKLEFEEGIIASVLNLMEGRGQLMDNYEKICVINYDEMHIDQRAEYDKKNDRILGPFKTAQVCLVRGLFAKWKQALYYNFDTDMKKELLFSIVKALRIIGYVVRVIVSDLGGTNRSVHNSLGIDEDACFFKVPAFTKDDQTFDETKIYVFADIPHMIKLIRNHILDGGCRLENGTIIDRQVYEEMMLFDNGEIKLHPGLNVNILDVKGSQRMKVGPAYTLFNDDSVNLANYALTLSNVRSKENVRFIVEFLQTMSNLIKIFSSYLPFDNACKIKSGYGNYLHEQRSVLDIALHMIKTSRLYYYSTKTKKLILRTTLLPCQKGIICSINSLILLQEEFFNKGFPYILTHRLDQNALESLFSRVRGMSGQNVNPSPLGFKNRLRLLILGAELPVPTGSNVDEEVDDEYFLTQNILCHNKDVAKDISDRLSQTEIDEIVNKLDLNNLDVRLDETRTSGHEQLKYIAGYLAYRFKNRNLGIPSGYLESENQNKENLGWTETISRGYLMIPNDELFELVKLCDKVFIDTYETFKFRKGIIDSFSSIVASKGNEQYLDVIKMFFMIRIKAKLRMINNSKYVNKKIKEKQLIKIKKY